MVIRSRLVLAPVLAILCACGKVGPPPVIDAGLSARVPPATLALAGINLDQLRASPLFAKSPPAMQAFLTPFADAHEVLIASTGTQLLAIARGVVPGATIAPPGIALYGDPALVAAGTASHPPAGILAIADSVAAGHAIWIALRGGVTLPLEGNAANLNNLLRATESMTIAIRPDDPAGIDITAQCPTPESAQHFEQSVRALASLTAATARDPQVSGALQGIVITRAHHVVRIALRAPLSSFSGLLSR
ncbi:MAG: hypothetical protein ABI806_28600 [Candidatus Solibacter sp.]